MRIFISSVVAGMEPFRDAAAAAARVLGHDVIRSEALPASPDTPQRVCLAEVRQADVVVVLVGSRYGAVQPSGRSATEEEYREARDRCGVIVMVQDGVAREPREEQFLRELQDWAGGRYTAAFADIDGLRDALTRALHEFELSRAMGPSDPEEIVARALSLLPRERGGGEAQVAIAIAGGPSQAVLRPSQLESESLAEELKREALFGPHRVLDSRHGTEHRIEGHRLVIEQRRSLIALDEQGSVLVVAPLKSSGEMMLTIIEEDLRQQILDALGFIHTALEEIDPARRLAQVTPVAAVLGGSYLGWKTRAEHAASPGRVTMGQGGREEPVSLSPPHRPRSALELNRAEIAEDLVVLLRRSRR